jgi:GMP synthase-like glutamine amidotransferase
LQQSHGDEVTSLPPGATLLGTSDTCEVEIFSIADRVLAFQSHPDFNCGFQQEISEPEYFKFGVIGLDFHKTAFLKCQDTSLGIETRNMFLGIIREFIRQESH